MTTNTAVLTDDAVLKAYEVLKPIVRHTPLQFSAYLSQKYGCNVYLKREDLQAVRSFKIRGAYYAISQVPVDVRQRGVVCASAGNHAQGVAWTSAKMAIPATIFMPVTTPKQKVDQVKFFGGDNVTIELTGDTFDEANSAALVFCEQHNQTFIAPFDDLNTMAGQGSLAVEVFNDAAENGTNVDFLFAAIGGGGLMSGISTHAKAVSPQTTVVGVEPSGAASMAKAFAVGHPQALTSVDKFVDGAAVQKVGRLTYATCQDNVDRLIEVPEGLVSTTILDLYTKLALVAEPAGALSIAALEVYKDHLAGKNVVCVVSGGNNDINRMQEIEERSLIHEGLQHYFVVNFAQRAGALRQFVSEVLNPDDDITKFEYTKKVNSAQGPVLIGVRLGEAKNLNQLLSRLSDFDANYINLQENQMLYRMLV
ncbi:threonine ammonia-lyase IlvA [Secundilactobacillus collinoides]|uniref:L-threonine dehydratase n=1 Tax=Secundilactobacillus collinoides DSM 20515 = JCM 1123 TaxID=1423733 RepID=A0A0R2BEQ5_SECCO|nr:threonine ammonia-lyase IlvA [Secundilactobacillus collinoides]KRM77681.1 threonine dehydratase [Secundilactobacillus collinoides DSM 20515 = JCM 1123]